MSENALIWSEILPLFLYLPESKTLCKMKKSHLCRALCLLCCVLLAACSRPQDTPDILQHIPADVERIQVFRPAQYVASVGGRVDNDAIVLPDDIADDLSSDSDLRGCLRFVNGVGLDFDYAVETQGSVSDIHTQVYPVRDAARFRQWLKGQGYVAYDKADGVTFYENATLDGGVKKQYLALTDSYLYVGTFWEDVSRSVATSALQDYIAHAARASFATSPYASLLTEGNAYGAVVRYTEAMRASLGSLNIDPEVINMMDGALAVVGHIDANRVRLSFKWLDAEGKAVDLSPLAKYADLTATVHPDVLAYLPADEPLTYACALRRVNWDAYFNLFVDQMTAEGRVAASVVKSYLSKIDGTVAFSMGLTHGLESWSRLLVMDAPMDQLSMTLLFEVQEGRVQSMMSDFRSLLQTAGLGYQDLPNGFTCDPMRSGKPLYVQAEGNVLAVATHPVQRSDANPHAQLLPYAQLRGALAFSAQASDALMQDLGVTSDATLTLTSPISAPEAELSLTLSGDSTTGVLAKLVRLVAEVQRHLDADDDDADEVAMEDYSFLYE